MDLRDASAFKNAMMYWKEKLLSCYRHRLGEEIRIAQVPYEPAQGGSGGVKRERLRREEEEQNERRTAAEAELQRQRQEEFDARVERGGDKRIWRRHQRGGGGGEVGCWPMKKRARWRRGLAGVSRRSF